MNDKFLYPLYILCLTVVYPFYIRCIYTVRILYILWLSLDDVETDHILNKKNPHFEKGIYSETLCVKCRILF